MKLTTCNMNTEIHGANSEHKQLKILRNRNDTILK